MESLVSLSWCIRQGTRGEGDGDADYLPPLIKAVNKKAIVQISNQGIIFTNSKTPDEGRRKQMEYRTCKYYVTNCHTLNISRWTRTRRYEIAL